jgi:hypothetical protein
MVKAYARSAAGMDVELVSEIRSPITCLKTIDYLMKRLDNDEFDFLHSWIWDRTRAVRKDLRTQRIEQRSDINILLTCLERSARFLILSTHQMARTKKVDYVHQQDIEQLNQTLMSLKERYKDNRRVGYPSENEPEFWAYRLILAPLFTNTQFENELHYLPSDLRNNPRVRTAIEIYRALKAVIFTRTASFIQAQANWKRFWELIKSPSVSYLMACAAEVSFQRVRHVILDCLWRAYRMGNHSNPKTVDSWTVPKLKEVLGFDKGMDAVKLCEAYGFQFNTTNGGPTFLDVTAKGFVKTALPLAADLSPQTFSQGIVEKKRHDRAFSAIIQAMTVQQAQRNGLMINSTHAETEDETSLFIPDAPAAPSNSFTQPKGSFGATTTLAPTTNLFKPAAPTGFSSDVAKTNPFLKKPSPVPDAGPSNSFAPKAPSTTPGFLGSSNGVQNGLFDASKNPIKFASSGADVAPATSASKPNPFLPATTSAPVNPFLPAQTAKPANAFVSAPTSAPAPSFLSAPTSTPTNSVLPAPASTSALLPGIAVGGPGGFPAPSQPAATPPSSTNSSFVFPPFAAGGDKDQSRKSAFAFTPESSTPTGSPAPAAPAIQDSEQQKAEEAARQRKAQAKQQRARDEQARQAREAAEQHRIEAQRQQRLQEEERVRLAQEQQRREAEAQRAQIQARESAYDALAEHCMFNPDEGLMMQFVENMTANIAKQVILDLEEEKRQRLMEKMEAVGDRMYEQRILALKRIVMAAWIAKIEKKKRDQKARDRRKRLKELRSRVANGEDIDTIAMESASRSRASSDATVDPTPAAAVQPSNDTVFRKPQIPVSGRRARRTEQRRRASISQSNGGSELALHSSNLEQQSIGQTGLTPVSMASIGSFGSSQMSNAGYSEAYYKSTEPQDRTETDYFRLRAQGLDPCKIRKRSFDSSEDEDKRKVEPKRSRIKSPSTTQQQSVPLPASRVLDRRARLDAIEQKFRKSEGSPQAASSVASFNGRSSFPKRSSALVEQARQLLEKTRSTRASPSNVQHDYGRSVPSLHRRASSLQQSTFGTSMGSTAKNGRAAYWDRPSRFVPKALYGQGPDAIRAYRQKYGLSSPANSRPSSTEPLAISSPIPTRMPYMPVNGYTQEQYTESEASGVEIVDVDAEDDDIEASTEEEEEYEGDSESVEDEEEGTDDEGDSPMQDAESGGSTNGHFNGHNAHVHGNYKGYNHINTYQPAQSIKQPNNPAGNTQDDAIELSD